MAEPPRTALLLGATGLVGSHVLRLLAHDDRWSQVVTLGRRPMDLVSANHEHHVLDFDHMTEHAEWFACDDVFCCLGTTAKQTPNTDAYRRVDLGYPFTAAQLAQSQGATQYLLVSALGADPSSRIFYNRLKGEAEQALRTVDLESLSMFRPSLLTGDRDETRLGEQVGEVVLTLTRPFLLGPLRKYRPTPAETLARVVVEVAAERPAGAHVWEADAILARATRA